MSKFPRTASTRLALILSCGLILVLVGLMFHGYSGRTLTEVLSYQVQDNWCDIKNEGVGSHCFGDFGLPYYRGLAKSAYSPGNYAAANTPLTAALFEALRILPYNFSLFIYLLSLGASLFLPFLLMKSPTELGTRMNLAVLSGLFSIGGIAVLDRGNHVAWLVPLLILFLCAVQHEKWRQAMFFLTVMSMLKFWGLIFILVLLAKSRWREAIGSVFLTVFGSLGILALFPGKLSSSLDAMLDMAGNRDYANAVAGYSISLHSLVRRIDCLMTSSSWCNTRSQGSTFIGSSLLSMILAGLLSIICLLLVRGGAPTIIWSASIISLGFLAVPEAPAYNLALVSAIVVLICVLPEPDRAGPWRFSSSALLIAVTVSTIPVTYFSTHTSRFVLGNGDTPGIFRSDYWTTPIVWVFFLGASCHGLIRSKFLDNH